MAQRKVEVTYEGGEKTDEFIVNTDSDEEAMDLAEYMVQNMNLRADIKEVEVV